MQVRQHAAGLRMTYNLLSCRTLLLRLCTQPWPFRLPSGHSLANLYDFPSLRISWSSLSYRLKPTIPSSMDSTNTITTENKVSNLAIIRNILWTLAALFWTVWLLPKFINASSEVCGKDRFVRSSLTRLKNTVRSLSTTTSLSDAFLTRTFDRLPPPKR